MKRITPNDLNHIFERIQHTMENEQLERTLSTLTQASIRLDIAQRIISTTSHLDISRQLTIISEDLEALVHKLSERID